MASHDMLDAASGATPDVVPTTAPTTAQVDAVPIAAPNAVLDMAPCATRGGARATASGGAPRVPRCRVHRAAHVPTPDAADVPSQAAPAALAGGPVAPPPRIDIDALFDFQSMRLLDCSTLY